VLAASTTEAVLARLGLSSTPDTDLDGLNLVYGAWCRNVPFDNLVKRIHLVSGSAERFPNGEPEAFFASYLRHGTGGTCWPSSNALYALLATLGFDVRRGSAAMRDDLSGPIPTHGTILATVDGADYWVDTSMLTERVFPVRRLEATVVDDPLHSLRVEPVERLWRVWWSHPFLDEMLGCLLLDDDVTEAHYLDRYEWSRGMSPFNAHVYATRNAEGARLTAAFGQRFERRAGGTTSAPLGEDRTRILVEELGYSEEIVASLPADEPAALPS
jgi:N-hydroxyarylamine O-acetyltransferase